MRHIYIVLLLSLLVFVGCQWQTSTTEEQKNESGMTIERYDRMESLYLTMADIAALHQMKTDYPLQTRTLIEDVLQLGPVNAPDINIRLLNFFQDSTLQVLIKDVGLQFEQMDDVNAQLNQAFGRLKKMMPDMQIPKVYAQIGSLDQSIVVTDGHLGISLDKYLGADYPFYVHYGYSEKQRAMMTRDYIVPDCLGFYLLSLNPLPEKADTAGLQRRWHMAKIQTVVNQAMGRKIFSNEHIDQLEKYWRKHRGISTADFLLLDSISLK